MIRNSTRFEVVIRSAFILLFSLTTLLLIGSAGVAQTALNHARLGNNIEDITFVNKGPLANHIVMLDGYEVFRLPVEEERRAGGRDDNDGNDHGNDEGHNQSVRKLFDLRHLPIQVAPRGIAYVESEKLFVLQDPSQRTKLFFVDRKGHLRSTRTIQYLNGFDPVHLEGLVYLPVNSPVFPDHLVMVAWDENLDCDDGQGSRLEVMTRQGQVVAEIFPDSPLRCNNFAGVGSLEPNRLLVTSLQDNTISTLDFTGHIVGPQVSAFGAIAIEGIVQLSDGRVVTADYATGRLYYFSAGLNRRAGDDRSNTIGLSLSGPAGVAWNSDTHEHLVLTPYITTRVVAAVSQTLGSGRTIVNLTSTPFARAVRLSYLPDEHLIALAHPNSPRAVLLFNAAGSLVEQVVTPPPPGGSLRTVEYIPTTQQFAVGFGPAPLLRIISRTGALVRTIDLAPTGITAVGGVAYFNSAHPSGGEFLILDSGLTNDRAIITDFNGNLLSEFNYRDRLGVLNATDVAFISTGPQAGAFSLVDLDSSELVVFRLN